MNDLTIFKDESGLTIHFIKKENFSSSYCSLAFNFGGNDLTYEINNEIKHFKPGIAHFLEHMNFKMEDGVDATKEFNKIDANVNAYTSIDKTMYFFDTLYDIKEPLKLLLDVIFTPNFKNIKTERKIILSEYERSIDDPYTKIVSNLSKKTYGNHEMSKYILGNKTSINSITPFDLEEAYNLFYKPSNAILTIVSDSNIDEIKEVIKNSMKKYTPNSLNAKLIYEKPLIKNDSYTKMEANIYDNMLYINIRLDNLNYKDPILNEKLNIILSSLFLPKMPFFKSIENLLEDKNVDFTMNSLRNHSVVTLYFITNDANKLKKIIENKLRNLSIEDINLSLIEEEKMESISNYYRYIDSVSSLGAKYSDLIIEGSSLFELKDKVRQLGINDLQSIINEIKNSCYTFLKVLPKIV